MDERKQKRFVEAKTVWSVRTRAAMVRLGDVGKLMRRERKENQVVAAGPKTTVFGVLVVGREGKREWERGQGVGGEVYRRRRGPFGLCGQSCAWRGRLSQRLAGP